MRCGAAAVGIMGGVAEGFAEECAKRLENQGYIRVDKLTPEQRADLERRGILPKEEPPYRMGY